MKALSLLVMCLALVACEGPEGPMGPQGEQGPPGIVDEFEIIHFAVTQSEYDGEWIFVRDDRINPSSTVQVYVVRPESSTGLTTTVLMEFEEFAEEATSLLETKPKMYIGTSTVAIQDPSKVLLGEIISVVLLPEE